MKKETIIISLGGSLIAPDDIDTKFIKSFRKFLDSQIKKGRRFILICGGGKTARRYMNALPKIRKCTRDESDWMGIHSTELNARLIQSAYKDIAEKEIVFDPRKKANFKKPLLIAYAWKPGWSTDYDAVLHAVTQKIKKVINLSNIEYVYDKDPNKCKDAKKIILIDWQTFRKDIVGFVWKSGLNMPFDPIASKLAQKHKLEVAIMKGSDIKNLANYLDGKNFKGTIIR